MLTLLRLIRPPNCLMVAVAVLIGGLLSVFSIGVNLLLAMAAAVLITGAGNTFNDWADVEIDRINRPSRPIPSGKISKRDCLTYSIMLFAIGLVLASMINWLALSLAVLNVILLITYPLEFKQRFLAGNVIVSWLVGSVFIFGGVSQGMLSPVFLVLALLAGLTTLAREITKDFEDFQGDKLQFKPHLSGQRFIKSKTGVAIRHSRLLHLLGVSAIILAIIVSPLPYTLGLLSLSYLIILIPADIIFAICGVFLLTKRRDYGTISRWIKYGMLIALLAFIVSFLF